MQGASLSPVILRRAEGPGQAAPLQDPELEARCVALLGKLTAESDAPAEQYERLGLAQD